MLTRFLLTLSVLFIFTACSTTEEIVIEETAPRDAISGIEADALAGPAAGTQADLSVNIGNLVFFGYDSSDLSAEARDVLLAQAKWLQRYPSVFVTIEGHADERGTREYNLALGERRADSVKNYLVALGVDPMRINVISYGKERPAVPGANDAAWAQNRRGVTVVE